MRSTNPSRAVWLTAMTLATPFLMTVVPDATATPPPVTTNVAIVVDDVRACDFTLQSCNGLGARLVPDHIPVGPVTFTLLDRRPEATRTGTLYTDLADIVGPHGDPSPGPVLMGDGATATVNISGYSLMMYTRSTVEQDPWIGGEAAKFRVIPVGSPYQTTTHVDIVADSDGNGFATVTPGVVRTGLVDVSVIDRRANPESYGPLHVTTWGAPSLPIDLTAPAGEVCGMTTVCSQYVVAAPTFFGQTIQLRAPSIGGPPEYFDLGFLTSTDPLLASADAPAEVSLTIWGSQSPIPAGFIQHIRGTHRETRFVEAAHVFDFGPPDTYTTYLNPASGTTKVIIKNTSGMVQTCSIPGFFNSFNVTKTGTVTKHVALNTAGVVQPVICVNGSLTSKFEIRVH